jgi:predicted RNA-binding protein with EMAP domain
LSNFEESDLNKQFSEIMKLSNIKDFDEIVKSEVFKSIKENLLLLSTINEFEQNIQSVIFSILEGDEIEITDDMKEALSSIYKLMIDYNDYMLELQEENFDIIFEGEDGVRIEFIFDDEDNDDDIDKDN